MPSRRPSRLYKLQPLYFSNDRFSDKAGRLTQRHGLLMPYARSLRRKISVNASATDCTCRRHCYRRVWITMPLE